MVKPIILDSEKWSRKILEIGLQFNKYAKKGSLRMVSLIIDRAFDIMANDKDPHQYDAAILLKRIRALNPELFSRYISTLIDAKFSQGLLEDDDYLIPDYIKYPISDKPDDNIVVHDTEGVNKDASEINSEKNESEEKRTEEKKAEEIASIKSELINWEIMELLKFNILRNITKITYSEINSNLKIKKCACADGVFDRNETDIWACTECGAPYHENCVKVISLIEGKCRICGQSFIFEGANIEDKEENVSNGDREDNGDNEK